jgi:hypothetical protein
VNVFHRISRAISRLSRSAAPVPSGGAMATQIDVEQVEAVEEQELTPEERHEHETESE